MSSRPIPVIVLSGRSRDDAPLAIEALHRGAVDFIDKRRYSLVDFETLRDVLVQRILEVSQHRPARQPDRTAATRQARQPDETPEIGTPRPVDPARPGRGQRFGLLVLGASTGGPVAIQRVLGDLGADLPVPAVVAQHMPVGFTRAFAERLNSRLPLSVREAGDSETLVPATVYIAPAGRHLLVERHGGGLRTRLSEEPAGGGSHKPSADVLFRSAASAAGGAVLAVLLTGMGRDGAGGMAELAAAGAHTLAQDEATSVVWGMPRAAAQLGAVREILPLGEIGPRLRQLLRAGRAAQASPGVSPSQSGSGSMPNPSANRLK
jgi:two-component system chemotaxis response regulator CheB